MNGFSVLMIVEPSFVLIINKWLKKFYDLMSAIIILLKMNTGVKDIKCIPEREPIILVKIKEYKDEVM